MKANSLIQNLLIVILTSGPFLYAAWVWDKLPESVPTHFGLDGKPDAYGSKLSFLIPVIVLMGAGLVAYFLIKNLEKFDPKRAKQVSENTFHKLALLLLVFMSCLSLYIIHSTLQSGLGSFLFVLMGLFFAAMGNLMHSVKPNYFIGIRLPWTLSNDENWRKTHQLASKVWFVGGLVVAALGLILPEKIAIFVLFGIITVICLIPVIYSYREFKKMAQ